MTFEERLFTLLTGGLLLAGAPPCSASPEQSPTPDFFAHSAKVDAKGDIQVQARIECPEQMVACLGYETAAQEGRGSASMIVTLQVEELVDLEQSCGRGCVRTSPFRLTGACQEPSEDQTFSCAALLQEEPEERDYYFLIRQLECEGGSVTNIRDPKVHIDPGPPYLNLSPSFEPMVTYNSEIDTTWGARILIPLFERCESTWETSIAGQGATLAWGAPAEEEIELLDVEVLWLRTFVRGDIYRLRSLLGLGVSFVFEDEGRLGDSIAPVCGLRFEVDFHRRSSLVLEARRRWFPSREVKDSSREAILGFGFRLGR